MAHVISAIPEYEIVRVCHTGTLDRTDLATAKNGAFLMLADKGWRNIVVDLRHARIDVLTLDVARVFSDMDLSVPHGALIALIRPPHSPFDYYQLLKSLLEAFSKTRVEVFWNEHDAVGWLVRSTIQGPNR